MQLLINSFYNIVNGEKISTRERLSGVHAATDNQQATVPDAQHALLAVAVSAARNAFAGWDAVPFARRKSILAGLLNKIDDHADELSALLSAEQSVTLAEGRWEIDLLTEAFGPALMQVEGRENQRNLQPVNHVTRRYIPISASGNVRPRNLPIILSFGKVLPALLAGDTVVLILSAVSPLAVLRISEHIRGFLPPGVFNVVTGRHDLWSGMMSHSGIDLISFTRSTDNEKPALERLPGLGPEQNDSRATMDPERIALFGSIGVRPIVRKPGRSGLANTLFEILSFQPTSMKTQVSVWGLARKASYNFPIFRRGDRQMNADLRG